MKEKRLFNIVLTTLCWCLSSVTCVAAGDSIYEGFYSYAMSFGIVALIFAFLGVLCTRKTIRDWNKES